MNPLPTGYARGEIFVVVVEKRDHLKNPLRSCLIKINGAISTIPFYKTIVEDCPHVTSLMNKNLPVPTLNFLATIPVRFLQ